jgi:hypothetical protein
VLSPFPTCLFPTWTITVSGFLVSCGCRIGVLLDSQLFCQFARSSLGESVRAATATHLTLPAPSSPVSSRRCPGDATMLYILPPPRTPNPPSPWESILYSGAASNGSTSWEGNRKPPRVRLRGLLPKNEVSIADFCRLRHEEATEIERSDASSCRGNQWTFDRFGAPLRFIDPTG